MKKLFLHFALIVGLLTSASTAMAQVNMSRYITLTVKSGEAIMLDFKAVAAATPVRIVSGSNTQDITVGTNWYNGDSPSTFTVTAQGTEMKIYGDITGFVCSYNGANLNAIDVSKNTLLEMLNCKDNKLNSLDISKNTKLRKLYCHGNNFSTQALDDIFCALPDRTGKENGVIHPVYSNMSSNHATVLATNKTNATAKNWKVQYFNEIDIPATTGTYTCPQPNMSRYITLTVTNGAAIKLDFKAAAAATPIRIVSGSNTQDITVGTNWTGITSYTAAASTMTIYGDLIGFDCSKNGANLTALNVSKNTQLETLGCKDNKLSSLDLSHNTLLDELYCSGNKLSSLDVSRCTKLTQLGCFSNQLNSLDVSGCTKLTVLGCSQNNLTSLDVSGCTKLTQLYCYDNAFTTDALDDIYCALPDRTGNANGKILPIFNSSSSDLATVLATNKANAIAKNWKVQYHANGADIPATTGSYVCPAKYDLWIAGVQVTAANCSDLSVIDGVSDIGKVKYDPDTKTLTLRYAQISTRGAKNAIVSDIDGLIVKVIGRDNKVYSTDWSALRFNKPTTITGRGSLYAESQSNSGILVYKTNLTIDSSTVKAKGKWGISGKDGSISNLTIKNAYITAEGNDYGSIADFASLTLDGCHITKPTGAAFDATQKAIALGGAVAKSEVEISRYVDTSRYITLTVRKYSAIKLNFQGAVYGTPVRIVSGTNTQDIAEAGSLWASAVPYTAYGTEMRIYGDLDGFSCSNNKTNLSAIDLSNNTQLTHLWCGSNTLSSLDVSKNTELKWLSCDSNTLRSLNVSKNTELKFLFCSSNTLSSLDVSKNMQLTDLGCSSNTLSSLDVSKNTELNNLSCSSNNLSRLDVSKNTELERLWCYGNNFSPQALDDIYCSVPDRTGSYGYIYPLKNSSDPNQAIVLASNAENATSKNWDVQYYDDDTDITTTGSYDCSTAVAEATAEPSLTLYPNPVADVLYLSATARTVRIYNVYGIEVAHATDTDRVEVANLPAGVYTVKADGSIAKMVKR